LPGTLDETYSRTLRQIKEPDWGLARRLFQCVAVASRPLRVEELAEFLAFKFKEEPIPEFHEDWRSEDPLDAVLSICSSLLSVVNEKGSSVIQFCHVSVKEFLMSGRLAETNDNISRRYHISLTPAHTIVAQACLFVLLHLDSSVSQQGLTEFPLAEYAAEHWVDHARFENISANAEEGMKRLFDPSKPHLGIWLWIYDPELDSWKRKARYGRSLTPRGTALHYAALCGLERIVEYLAIAHSQDVHSRAFEESTALHVAAGRGHAEVVRILLERGADPTARDKYGQTALYIASERENVEGIRMLLERGADPTAQDNYGKTALYIASERGNVEAIRMLLELGRRSDSTGQGRLDTVALCVGEAKCGSHSDAPRAGRRSDNTGRVRPDSIALCVAGGKCGSHSDAPRAGRRSDSTGRVRLDTIPLCIAGGKCGRHADASRPGRRSDSTGQERPDTIALCFAGGKSQMLLEAFRCFSSGAQIRAAQDKNGRTPSRGVHQQEGVVILFSSCHSYMKVEDNIVHCKSCL
jgi:hypothetical protein